MAEHKYFDLLKNFNFTTLPITTTGTLVNMTEFAQGLTDITRIGDKVTGTSLEMRVEVSPPVLSPQQALFAFRLVVFIWKDESVPTPADVIQQVGLLQMLVSPLDHDKKVKRKILHDEVFWGFNDVNTDSTGTDHVYTNKKIYIPLSKYGSRSTINYISGGTTAINHIYYLIITPVVDANNWFVNIYSRYNFIDC